MKCKEFKKCMNPDCRRLTKSLWKVNGMLLCHPCYKKHVNIIAVGLNSNFGHTYKLGKRCLICGIPITDRNKSGACGEHYYYSPMGMKKKNEYNMKKRRNKVRCEKCGDLFFDKGRNYVQVKDGVLQICDKCL